MVAPPRVVQQASDLAVDPLRKLLRGGDGVCCGAQEVGDLRGVHQPIEPLGDPQDVGEELVQGQLLELLQHLLGRL